MSRPGCGVARGTVEHWLQKCRVIGGVRQKLDEKWGKCGMRGVPLWGWLMNPNVGRVADEKSRIEAVRCANWAIRTMMRMKVAKEEVHPGHLHPHHFVLGLPRGYNSHISLATTRLLDNGALCGVRSAVRRT